MPIFSKFSLRLRDSCRIRGCRNTTDVCLSVRPTVRVASERPSTLVGIYSFFGRWGVWQRRHIKSEYMPPLPHPPPTEGDPIHPRKPPTLSLGGEGFEICVFKPEEHTVVSPRWRGLLKPSNTRQHNTNCRKNLCVKSAPSCSSNSKTQHPSFVVVFETNPFAPPPFSQDTRNDALSCEMRVSLRVSQIPPI